MHDLYQHAENLLRNSKSSKLYDNIFLRPHILQYFDTFPQFVGEMQLKQDPMNQSFALEAVKLFVGVLILP
jgi:hypothetical protein